MAACQNGAAPDDSSRNIQLLSDTTAYHNNVFSDTAATAKAEIAPAKISDKPRIIIIRTEKTAPAKSTVTAPVYTQPASVPAASTEPIATTPTVGNKTETANSGNGSVASAPAPEVAKKKGWSKAAQGAAIGGVGGAIGGAIISKKKGLGAVVGGVVGAAGGYIIGKNMDKKDNRLVME